MDTVDTLIQQCNFDSNAGFNQVRLQAAQVRNVLSDPNVLQEYRVVIRDNIFTDATAVGNVGFGDLISISTLATGNVSDLELVVENNGQTAAGGIVGFTSNRRVISAANPTADAVISTIWNGNVLATYQGNNIRMSAASTQIGIRLVTTRSSATNDIVYASNVFDDGGGFQEFGLLMDFAGSTNLSILDNYGEDANGNRVVDGFTMNGAGIFVDDRAIDLTFRSTGNAIDISRNQITYNSIDGTAIIFESISGPSTVNMDGNTIIMFDDAIVPNERAIVFQNVIGNLTLSSLANQNNVVLPQTFTTIQLTIPGGVSTGQFLINGIRQP